MALIDELRAAAEFLPPSHVPTPAELPRVLAALLAHVEHGDEAVAHATEHGFQGFVKLFSPPQEEPEPEPQSEDEQTVQLRARVAELEQQLHTREATDNRTTAADPIPVEQTSGTQPSSTVSV